MIRLALIMLLPLSTLAQRVDSILVDISDQRLYTFNQGEHLGTYPVSTSKYGSGSQAGSNKTPLGLHRVHSKYGNGLAAGSVLRGRIATGQVASIESRPHATGAIFSYYILL